MVEPGLPTIGPSVLPLHANALSPAPEDIRLQLRKILTSRFFSNSQRLSRFLIFATGHALSGNRARLKEYLVGVEVFDRKSEYDPRIDPIVRVEARRLRTKLESYYAFIGPDDPLLILLPKGTYTPVFRFREHAQPGRPPCVGVPGNPLAITVVPFTDLIRTAVKDDHFCEGLTEELIHRITRLGGLRLVAWHPLSQSQDPANSSSFAQADAVLRGSIRRESDSVRVVAQLIDTKSGTYLWSEIYSHHTGNPFLVQDRIAQAIVARLEVTRFRT